MKRGCVYIMSNAHRTVLYTGVTSDLRKRVLQHKKGVYPGAFTDQFLCHDLIWFKDYGSIKEAIAMEKRIKRWRRTWKWRMIDELNPRHEDLSNDWYDARDVEM